MTDPKTNIASSLLSPPSSSLPSFLSLCIIQNVRQNVSSINYTTYLSLIMELWEFALSAFLANSMNHDNLVYFSFLLEPPIL